MLSAKQLSKFLWQKSPREVYYLAKRRFSRNSGFFYDIDFLLASPKHMNVTVLIDRLFRYERILQTHGNWKPLEFFGRRVLEIGSGPLLGWGPMAVFLGCKEFVCAEDIYDPKVLNSDRIWQNYYIPIFNQLTAVFGPKCSFDVYRRGIEEIRCHRVIFNHADLPTDYFDIVLSNSVFEHVMDFPDFAQKLRRVSSSSSQHLHAVDFSNHLTPDNPFKGYYDLPRQITIKRFSGLNLLKPSEMMNTLNSDDFKFMMTPYLYHGLLPKNPDGFWQQFSQEDLTLSLGLISRSPF